jgi:hypothetical protein
LTLSPLVHWTRSDDAQIIPMIHEHFVPIAVDNTRLQNQDDEDGRLFRV